MYCTRACCIRTGLVFTTQLNKWLIQALIRTESFSLKFLMLYVSLSSNRNSSWVSPITHTLRAVGICSGKSFHLSTVELLFIPLTRKQVNRPREIPDKVISTHTKNKTGKHCLLQPLCRKHILVHYYSQTLLANLVDDRRYLILKCYQVQIKNKLSTIFEFSSMNS